MTFHQGHFIGANTIVAVLGNSVRIPIAMGLVRSATFSLFHFDVRCSKPHVGESTRYIDFTHQHIHATAEITFEHTYVVVLPRAFLK